MDVQTWTYIIVGITFLIYISIAIIFFGHYCSLRLDNCFVKWRIYIKKIYLNKYVQGTYKVKMRKRRSRTRRVQGHSATELPPGHRKIIKIKAPYKDPGINISYQVK